MAKARVRAWPWRSILALILAVAAAATAHGAGRGFRGWFQPGPLTSKVIAASATAAFCVFAAIAVAGLSGKVWAVLQPVMGSAHAAVVRYATVLAAGITALIIALDLLKLPVGQLVVGGALTTILVGIAAQQALSNVFAGIVLLLSRPFGAGDRIHLRSGALNGPIEGTVAEIGITYVRLATDDHVLHLPNSQVLAAAVGQVTAASPPAGPSPPIAPPPGSAA